MHAVCCSQFCRVALLRARHVLTVMSSRWIVWQRLLCDACGFHRARRSSNRFIYLYAKILHNDKRWKKKKFMIDEHENKERETKKSNIKWWSNRWTGWNWYVCVCVFHLVDCSFETLFACAYNTPDEAVAPSTDGGRHYYVWRLEQKFCQKKKTFFYC